MKRAMEYFFFYTLAYFLFSMTYIYIVVPYFSYIGYYIDISIEKILLSIFYLLLFSLILDKKDKVSVSLINALIGFSITPMLVLFSIQNLSIEYTLYMVFSVIFIIFISKIRFNFKLFPLNLNYLLIPILILSFFSLVFLFLKNYNYFNLDITRVYEYRLLISENTPIWLTYMYNLLFKGLIPILFLYYLFHSKSRIKKIILSFILVALYILIFGITSHKFFLFIGIILIILYFITSFLKSWRLFFIKSAIFILIITLITLPVVKKSEFSDFYLLMISLFIRRIFFVPALLNFYYFDFFKYHDFVCFTDSRFLPFKFVLTYPYDTDISHLIGREVFGKPDMAANTGWLGSGYAHLGFAGMLIYAFVISLVLKYLDYVSQYLRKDFVIMSFIPYIGVLFLSSDLKTVFVTHGLILYIILMGVLSYNQKKKEVRFIHEEKSLSYFNRSSTI